MSQSFGMLRVFAWIHVVFGFLLITAAVVIIFAILFNVPDDRLERFLISYYGMAVIIGLLVAGVTSAAYGQFIQVVIKIEENTRP
jgi:hypothetical protein